MAFTLSMCQLELRSVLLQFTLYVVFSKKRWQPIHQFIPLKIEVSPTLVWSFFFNVCGNWKEQVVCSWSSENNNFQSFSSVSLFKQQRYLAIYTLASTASHTIFALTQFLWAYSFIVSDWELLTFVRNTVRVFLTFFQRIYFQGPFIYDLTTFTDPIVLFALSKQVRRAMFTKIIGSTKFNYPRRSFTVNHSPWI